MAGLQLQLLRDPCWRGADGRSAALNPKDAALLALLAVDGPTSRDRVIALLWPDECDLGPARNALRQRLFRLRRTAGAELIRGDELLALHDGIAHDLADPQAALAADPAGALAGELLGTMDYGALIDFSAWLDGAREQWRGRRREALAALASRLEAQERIAEALVCAERLARDEPLLEHAQRRLMRLHYRRGDRAAALAGYARLADGLREQLQGTPSQETAALARLIEASGALPVAAPPQAVSLRRPPRLVGRDAEWRRIDEACARGQIVFVAGEPGIGKSRLLEDFVDGRWVRLPCRPGDARVPLTLIGRLVRALEGRLPAADAEAADPLPGWARAELARLAPALGAPAPGRLDAGRLLQALEAALAAAAPAGVAVDDLQFADEASLELLPPLTAGVAAPWLFALRSEGLPPGLGAWIDAPDLHRHLRVELGPLDLAAVAALLDSLALPGFEAAAWATRLLRHGGGNPLFILETLRALPATGGPPASAAPAAALPRPEPLRRLLERRLALLSPAALKLARIAAVAAQDFRVDLAAAVLDCHALDLLDPWHELEAAQVLHDGAFAHDLVFEAARDSVPAPLRRWLHARIAGWLQAQDADPVRQALHWREAGEPARAALAFAAAAERARHAGRLAEQTRWLDAQIEAHTSAGQAAARFDAMVALAVAAREALAPAQALQHAQQLMETAADARQRAQAQLQIGSCELNAARFDLAFASLERAVAEAEAAHDVQTAQHARYLQALACAQLHGLPQALRRIEPLIPWAQAQQDASLRHSFAADLAILYDQADQRRRAQPLFEQALEYFDRAHETANAAPARMMFARSLLMLGELGRARLLLEQAVRDRSELAEGDGGQGIEVLNLGRVYGELGLYAEALALLEPLHARLAGPGSVVVRAAAALVMARVHAHLGQTARALNLLKDVRPEAPFHQQAAALWTRGLLQHEQPGERAALLDHALALFEPTDLPFVRLPILFDRLACLPDGDAVRRLREGVAECEARELPAPQMLARVRLVQVLLVQREDVTALVVARGIVGDLSGCHPVGLYLPELHAACRAAALAGGDDALARQCEQAALRWVATVLHEHVPESFRASFTQRNPVNRMLLAARAGGAR